MDKMNAQYAEIKVSHTPRSFREASFFAESFGFTLRLDECSDDRPKNADELVEQYFMFEGWPNPLQLCSNLRPDGYKIYENVSILKMRMMAAIDGYIQALNVVESQQKV